MAAVKEAIDIVHGWLKIIIDLGVTLILVAIVFDILFGTNLVVGRIDEIVGSLAVDHGVAGLIALLLLLLLYRKK
ncbi:MAG: hypothetical protein JSU61_05840 [Fidelibacterota bacterium]|nr:MAG: hypothetical protein JSU61_05840 [Candidatus Neomarinimicrobiota bacterium]